MKPFVVYRPTGPASAAPYRVLDECGEEIAWANAFLDAQCVRQLSSRSLRAYAMTCCTLPAGGGTTGPCPKSPNLPYWNMSAINWTSNPSPLPKQ